MTALYPTVVYAKAKVHHKCYYKAEGTFSRQYMRLYKRTMNLQEIQYPTKKYAVYSVFHEIIIKLKNIYYYWPVC